MHFYMASAIRRLSYPGLLKGVERKHLSEATTPRKITLKYVFTKSQKQLGKANWTNLVILFLQSLYKIKQGSYLCDTNAKEEMMEEIDEKSRYELNLFLLLSKNHQ